jgi:hypothetical protein
MHHNVVGGSQCSLSSDFTKGTGMPQQAFVVKHGDVAAELDTLPSGIFQARHVEEVGARIDMAALGRIRDIEQTERFRLLELFRGFDGRYRLESHARVVARLFGGQELQYNGKGQLDVMTDWMWR